MAGIGVLTQAIKMRILFSAIPFFSKFSLLLFTFLCLQFFFFFSKLFYSEYNCYLGQVWFYGNYLTMTRSRDLYLAFEFSSPLWSCGFSPYFKRSMFILLNFTLVQKLVLWPNFLESVSLLSQFMPCLIKVMPVFEKWTISRESEQLVLTLKRVMK